MTSTFRPPTDDDLVGLARMWVSLDLLVQEQYEVALDLTLPSLDLVQRVLENELIEPSNTYGLQCLGVALGRILAENVAGLDWAIVEDETGSGPCLRYLSSSFQLGVVTMVSERVEAGEPVDVRALYTWVEGMIEDHAAGAD